LDIDAVEKFVSSVIDVAVEFDAKVVVKTKKGSGIFERLMRKYPDRIVMINTRADIAPSMCADVTVGYLLSSPVIVSGVWGRNVLLHDPDRIIWDEWYNKEDSSFISCSAYELQRNMRRILSSEGINPTDMSAVDPFGDGKSQERIVAYISDVIDNFAGGKSHALDVASSNYRQKYGNDKVINNSLLYN
jgi:hypothetical protein